MRYQAIHDAEFVDENGKIRRVRQGMIVETKATPPAKHFAIIGKQSAAAPPPAPVVIEAVEMAGPAELVSDFPIDFDAPEEVPVISAPEPDPEPEEEPEPVPAGASLVEQIQAKKKPGRPAKKK